MKKVDILKDIQIAHRGIFNNEDVIENTKEAFILAMDNDNPVEFDVQMLKDGTLVVFHDSNIKRLTNVKKRVNRLTLKDIDYIKLKDTNSKIPLFDDILKIVDGKVLVDVELKESKHPLKFLKKVCNILDSYEGNFIIKSFNPLYICYIRLFRKEYIRGLLINKKSSRLPFSFFISNPDFICTHINMKKNKKIIKYANKYKCPVIYYGVDCDNLACDCYGYVVNKYK